MNQLGHALNVLDAPRVMALFVHTANPAAVTPDQEQVLRGLAREDLFTVVHERYLTDTARYADVLLPATTALEHDDLYCSYGQYVIQRVAPAIPPVGESWSNWDLFRRLAAEMGIDHPFFRQTVRATSSTRCSRSPRRSGPASTRRRSPRGAAWSSRCPRAPRPPSAPPPGRSRSRTRASATRCPAGSPATRRTGSCPSAW